MDFSNGRCGAVRRGLTLYEVNEDYHHVTINPAENKWALDELIEVTSAHSSSDIVTTLLHVFERLRSMMDMERSEPLRTLWKA